MRRVPRTLLAVAATDLPPSISPDWTPRSAHWKRRSPSRMALRVGRPLFVGGCPRSGTTLLQVMLDMHPDLAMPRETNFIRDLYWRRARFGDLRDPANRRAAAQWIFSDREHLTRRLLHRRLTPEEAIREIAASPPTIGSIIERCVRLHDPDAPRWGDKRPAYSGFIGPLLAMFPDAQYVNVVRDPRGVVASQLAMGWDNPEIVVPAAVVRWEFSAARTDHFARRLRPDQLLDVRYEDLVADPQAQVERILRFAGLAAGDVVDTMVRGERSGWFVGPHVQAGTPVTTAAVERWRERLTPAQVALVEHAVRPLMERYGYRAVDETEPEPGDIELLGLRRRIFRRRWRRTRRDELLRNARYRWPVVAAGHE